MISSFGKFAKSVGAKIILTLLGLSMIVFWGLGGLTNLSLSKNKPAIEVGSDTVSMQQLANAFDKERARMGTMMGGTYISPAQGIQNGLLQAAVQGQIIATVSKKVREDLGLTASDEAVRKYVERNPAFADALGNFDKGIFYAYLSQMRMSETELAHKLRDELAMNHLTNTITELGYNPMILAEAIYKYKNEKRSAVVAIIKPEDIKIDAQPTDEELQQYYEAYGEQFILPEYRRVQVVKITPDKMLDKVTIDDATLNEAIAQKRASYKAEEKRNLAQMLFKTKPEAEKVLSGLTADNFKETAQKIGQSSEQTNFGWVSKNDIMAELAEPVFATKKNAIVGPIESSLGWHLLLVQDIQKAKIPTDKEIKADIRKQFALDGAYEKTQETVRALEDALGQGDSLSKAAKTLGLSIEKIGIFDITGKTKDGKTIADEYKNATLLQDLFLLEMNEPSSVMEHGDGYIVAEVTEVTASAPQEFNAAKPALKKLWTAEQQKEKLQETAEAILARAKSGNSLQTQGVFKNFKATTENDITREKIKNIPQPVAMAVFKQSVGVKNTIATPISEGIALTTVTNITKADPKKDEFGVKVVKENLKAQTGEGMANEVMGGFAEEFGVTVNEKEIMDAFSVYQNQE